jgi:glucose-1-phosphate adenylyltransferase
MRHVFGAHVEEHRRKTVVVDAARAEVLVGQRRGVGGIVDTGAAVPPGTQIGVNREDDARRFYISEKGIALVTRDMLARLRP